MNRLIKDRLIVALISILLGLIAGAIIITVLGKNPFSAFYNLLQGSGLAPKAKYAAGKSMLSDFTGFIDFMTPMLLAALAVAVALKTGLFNIGVSGQMLVGGFVSSVLIGYSTLPGAVAKPLVILISAVSGGLIGALIGFLKYRFNVNEVVSSIMLNYIAEYVISFLINTKYIDPLSRQSKEISEASRLTFHQILIGGYRYDLALGFIIAVIAVIVVKLIFDKTVLGYELMAVGLSRKAARYAGIRVDRALVVSMTISGVLAGLAGATYYLGYFASIQPKVLPSTGFDAIAVCMVGGSSPIGILLATFFLEIIEKGSTYMSSQAGLEAEIASVIMGLILLTSACSSFVLERVDIFRERRAAGRKEKKTE